MHDLRIRKNNIIIQWSFDISYAPHTIELQSPQLIRYTQIGYCPHLVSL